MRISSRPPALAPGRLDRRRRELANIQAECTMRCLALRLPSKTIAGGDGMIGQLPSTIILIGGEYVGDHDKYIVVHQIDGQLGYPKLSE